MASALTMLAPKIKPLTLPNERAFTDGKPWFCIYELLTDLVWSRWLNIDQVLSFTCLWTESAILAAREANHSAGFGLSCPLTELTIK